MLLETIILKCSASMGGYRSTSAIYNIISGKKSIQTIQDVHIYRLEHLYGIYKELTKLSFDQNVAWMVDQQWLIPVDHVTVVPSESGLNWYHNIKLDLKQFNGMQRHSVEPIFKKRLLLLIQTLTNTANDCFSFIPVVDDNEVANWVRHVYRSINNPVQMLKQIYQELDVFLRGIDNIEANLFVDRLTGYKHYGNSIEQLKDTYGLTSHDIRLYLKKIHYHLIHTITENQTSMKLGILLTDLKEPDLMTQSAIKTYHLLKQGHTLNKIANIRQLKLNTIYDHMVEIVYFDSELPLEPYVSNSYQDDIKQAIQQTQSHRLKDIKQHLGDDVSYFQIRLIMATMQRMGDTNNATTIGK